MVKKGGERRSRPGSGPRRKGAKEEVIGRRGKGAEEEIMGGSRKKVTEERRIKRFSVQGKKLMLRLCMIWVTIKAVIEV